MMTAVFKICLGRDQTRYRRKSEPKTYKIATAASLWFCAQRANRSARKIKKKIQAV
jgi:hypothetical protein